jgi:hypothetical protein
VMVRAILGGEESTNLDAHVFVLGSEPENEGDPEGHNDNFLISALSLIYRSPNLVVYTISYTT